MNPATSDLHADGNADPVELAKFSALAHGWWDPEGELAALHAINPLRLDWIDRQRPLAGSSVLDVGCGGGILAEAMARKGAQVLGIDLAEKSLKIAQLHALESGTANVTYLKSDAETLAAERAGQFDLVTCMEVLEHVPDPASVVAACARLVKPGGTVCFATLHRNPKSFLLAVVAAEYLLHLVPRGTHQYARMLRPSELARFGRDAGLALTASSGLTYNPLTRRYRLSEDTSVNYMLAMTRP